MKEIGYAGDKWGSGGERFYLDRFTRWFIAPASAAVFLWLAIIAVRPISIANLLWAIAYAGISIAILAIMCYRIVLIVSGDRVWIRNVFTKRSFLRSDIVEIKHSYDGMIFILSDGRRITSLAVPTWNIVRILRLRNRADAVATTILDNRRR